MSLRVLAMAGLILASGAAQADSNQAKEYFNRATSEYALGKYAEAAADYERAFELVPDMALLYNAAQAHRIAGNKQRALLLYQNYLRIFGAEVKNTEEVQRHIAHLKQAIAEDERTQSAPPMQPAPVGTSLEKPGDTTSAQPSQSAVTRPAEVKKENKKDDRPLVKKPWFWAVIGGAAAVVIVGVTVGVVVGTPEQNPTPSFGTLLGN